MKKAVILAAGRGSRMQQRTKEQPKCFTKIAGKKLLEWQISAIQENSIEDVLVVGGYKIESLQKLRDKSELKFKVLENTQWQSSNMVRTLVTAIDHFKDTTCLISYSDIVYAPEHVKSLMANSGDIAVCYDQDWQALWSDRFEDPLSDAETFTHANGCLTGIGKKAASIREIEGQYMGLLKITPKGWHQLRNYFDTLSPSTIDQLDMTSLLQKLLDTGISIKVEPIRGRWCEVDSPSDLAIYEKKLGLEHDWSHDWR
jgi:choline kinase